MNHNIPNQKETNRAADSKKFFLPLTVSALAVAVAGGCLIACLNHTESSVTKLEQETSETVAESRIVETNLPAAASVQTEISDMISEPIKETVPESIPEIITEQEVINSESVSEEITVSETEPETTETLSASEQETPMTDEIYTESESTTTVTTPEHTSVVSASVEETTEAVPETSVQESVKNYREVLEHIFQYRSFQDDVFEVLNESDISENEFTVYDIDNDGKDELIVRWSNTAVSSVTAVIYGFDDEGNIYRKLKTTPYLRFYSNGIIEASALHSSGISGNFWAYSLYDYDTVSGYYHEAGYVDAWNREAMEDNEYEQEFPAYADVSGSGFVYFIYPPGTDASAFVADPLDFTEYQTWHTSYIGAATELNLPFRKLTEANIAEVE